MLFSGHYLFNVWTPCYGAFWMRSTLVNKVHLTSHLQSPFISSVWDMSQISVFIRQTHDSSEMASCVHWGQRLCTVANFDTLMMLILVISVIRVIALRWIFELSIMYQACTETCHNTMAQNSLTEGRHALMFTSILIQLWIIELFLVALRHLHKSLSCPNKGVPY